MLSTIVHQNNQNTSLKNYSAQVPTGRGFTLQVFKQPTLSSQFPYTTATAKFDVGYHNAATRVDPNWHHTIQQTANSQSLIHHSKTGHRPSEERELQRSQHTKIPGTYSGYSNDSYSSPSDVDTSSTATLSCTFSPTTESTSTMVEESPPPPPPLPSSLAINSRTPYTSSRPTAPGLVRSTSHTSYDSYISPAPVAIGPEPEDIEDELDLIARRNAELNATASKRDSLILTAMPSLDHGIDQQFFPGLPRSSSPEAMGFQAAINVSQSNAQLIPFPSNIISSDPAMIRPIDEVQFSQPLLGKWDKVGNNTSDPRPDRPSSRSEKRRTYDPIVSSQKHLSSIQDRPLPLPPPPVTREGNLSVSVNANKPISLPASQEFNGLLSYTFPTPNVPNDQQRGTRSRSDSISRKAPLAPPLSRLPSGADNGQYASYQAVLPHAQPVTAPSHYSYYYVQQSVSAAPINATFLKHEHRAPDSAPPSSRARKTSTTGESVTLTRMPSQGTAGRIVMPSGPPSRNAMTTAYGNTDQRFFEGETVHPNHRRHSEDYVIPTVIDQPIIGQEPHRRHSDGDQYRSRGAAARCVRWNENLICPSPIFTEKRKGWFNRRGDQLWTNTGGYLEPLPGQEFPLDLDGYPDCGHGWMNEDGVRIDMMHRLVPKLPLRSALKQGSRA